MDFIADFIGSFLSTVFGWLFETVLQPVIEWLVEWVIAPLVMGIVDFVRVFLSNTFYTISIFLLRLVDFVEMLFRALAGLPNNVDGASITLSLGEGGGGGDLLLQVLKSGGVQQAFLSMCVVGVFLLLVTTVFQIIKVEYTTEGAKNAKGPIFQKAFKGLANLLLLPLLVVFGIVFANQLLNLLDIATKASAGSTISGQLFITASTEAQYTVLGTADEDKWVFEKDSYIYREIRGIGLAFESFFKTLEASFNGENIFDTSGMSDSKPGADEGVNDQFAKQTLKYYKISDVSKYYDYSRINYLLLILGACIILKVLFFTCFGLVLRLYKCAILFIIAPAVIGMTPINEGGLGKWRTSFIGQVLSAYGTVLSINLFFIVVSVLLNIKVDIKGFGDGFDVLSDSLMTALLKCIFVIAGCILIEKFTKELGGYFGADDAASAGKDLAKQVGDTAKKSGKVAVAAGVGAFKVNRTMFKAGAGIAKGVGKVAAGAGKLGMKGIDFATYSIRRGNGYNGKKKISKDMKFSEFAKGRQERRKEFGDKVVALPGKAVSAVGGAAKNLVNGITDPVQTKFARFKSNLGLDTSAKDNLLLAKDDKQQKLTGINDELFELSKLKETDNWTLKDQRREKELRAQRAAIESDNSEIDKAQAAYDEDSAAKKTARKEARQERAANAKAWVSGKVMNAASFIQGVAMEGMDIVPGTKMFANMQKMQDKGADALGENFIAANKDAKEGPNSRKKRRENAAEETFKWAIDAQNRAGGIKITKMAIEKLELQRDLDINSINRDANTLNAAFHNTTDEDKRREYVQQAHERARAKGANISYEEMYQTFMNNKGKEIKLDMSALKLDFDTKALKEDIQKAIAGGMAKTTADLAREVAKAVQKQTGDKGNPQLVSMVISAVKQAIQEAQ